MINKAILTLGTAMINKVLLTLETAMINKVLTMGARDAALSRNDLCSALVAHAHVQGHVRICRYSHCSFKEWKEPKIKIFINNSDFAPDY